MSKIWRTYDPTWLVELAHKQLSAEKWLPNALSDCTRCADGGRAYFYFVDAQSNEWQFERTLFLSDKREGELILDVLQGQRIGGVEFLNRI